MLKSDEIDQKVNSVLDFILNQRSNYEYEIELFMKSGNYFNWKTLHSIIFPDFKYDPEVEHTCFPHRIKGGGWYYAYVNYLIGLYFKGKFDFANKQNFKKEFENLILGEQNIFKKIEGDIKISDTLALMYLENNWKNLSIQIEFPKFPTTDVEKREIYIERFKKLIKE